jgi:hypothetical protein
MRKGGWAAQGAKCCAKAQLRWCLSRGARALARLLHIVTHCRKHWQYILSMLIVGEWRHMPCMTLDRHTHICP